MPYQEVALAATRTDSPALAEWFGVSEPAMAWRLYNLSLVGERPSAEA